MISRGLSYKFSGRDLTREKIRIRDNHTCQKCGKKWQKGKRRFDVHHKDFDKEKTQGYDNYEKEKDNMITLCHKCHLNLPEHRRAIIEAGLKSKGVNLSPQFLAKTLEECYY